MTAGDLAVVLLGVAALGLCAATTALLLQVRRVSGELRDAVHELAGAVDEARAAAQSAHAEVERMDRLLTRSDGVIDRVDAATELAYDTFSKPVIRAMAVGHGTRQAVRRLRGSEGEQDGSA